MIKEQPFHSFVHKRHIGLTWDDLYGEPTQSLCLGIQHIIVLVLKMVELYQ